MARYVPGRAYTRQNIESLSVVKAPLLIQPDVARDSAGCLYASFHFSAFSVWRRPLGKTRLITTARGHITHHLCSVPGTREDELFGECAVSFRTCSVSSCSIGKHSGLPNETLYATSFPSACLSALLSLEKAEAGGACVSGVGNYACISSPSRFS